MIRRQKVYTGGGSPSLSVDRIGGDHAVKNARKATPRSARSGASGGGSSTIGSVSCAGGSGSNGGVDGRGGGDCVGQPLTPLDLCVGRDVLLMKRRMKVCGWDATAHVWWEKATGEITARQITGREEGKCC